MDLPVILKVQTKAGSNYRTGPDPSRGPALPFGHRTIQATVRVFVQLIMVTIMAMVMRLGRRVPL